MRPPELPPRDSPDGTSERRWDEYLERYDRALDLYARSVEQQDAVHLQYAEQLRLQAEAQLHQQQQLAHQKLAGRWVFVCLAVLLGGGVAVAVVTESIKIMQRSNEAQPR